MENEENKKGRPLKYKTVEEMELHIEEFFNECQPVVMTDKSTGKILTNSNGIPIVEYNPPTLTGLALHLGFESRQSIYDYEKRNDEFSYSIKVARLKCENWAEKNMLAGNVAPAAGIFVLKNYGWRDDKGLDLTSGGDKLPGKIEFVKG